MTTFDEDFVHPVNCCCVECGRKPHRKASSGQGIPVEDLPFNVIDAASVPVAEETFMKECLATHSVEMPRHGAVAFCTACGHIGAALTDIPCEPPAEWWTAQGGTRMLDSIELVVEGTMSELL